MGAPKIEFDAPCGVKAKFKAVGGEAVANEFEAVSKILLLVAAGVFCSPATKLKVLPSLGVPPKMEFAAIGFCWGFGAPNENGLDFS